MAESFNPQPDPIQPVLSESSRRVLIECFKQFDTNDDGRIGVEELPAALNFAGVHPTEEHTKDILRLLDPHGNGKLEISELVDNYHIIVQHSVNGEELLDAFNKLDTNKDGYLNLSELKKVLTSTGERWSHEEAGQLLQDLMKYDANGDGRFDYVEFVTMFMDDSYPFKKPEINKVKINETYKMVRVATPTAKVTPTDTTTNEVKDSGSTKADPDT